jgi:hypothetical protein
MRANTMRSNGGAQKGSAKGEISMEASDFESFKNGKLKEGFDEVLVRNWDPNFANETHSHPFDTDALVAQGEYWLSIGGEVRHLKAGDRFQVARGVDHSERYGPEGAVFWAARKY